MLKNEQERNFIMNKLLKKAVSGVMAMCVCASLFTTAFAEDWNINYTFGAPSSVSTNQSVRKQYIGLSPTTIVYITFNVTTGSTELSTRGFNPNIGSMTHYAPTTDDHVAMRNPDPNGCSLDISANENRVVAYGKILF